MASHHVTAKLGTMRRPQTFNVRPRSDGKLQIQSDKSCGDFSYLTGEGRLYQGRGPYATFAHLALARPYQYPPEFVAACLQACPSLGGETVIGNGAFVFQNTIQVF